MIDKHHVDCTPDGLMAQLHDATRPKPKANKIDGCRWILVRNDAITFMFRKKKHNYSISVDVAK